MPGFTPPDGSAVLAPSSAVPGWTAEYAVPLGGPGHLLLATFEQAAIGIVHMTLTEEWISVNQRYCEMIGYSREEILQQKLDDPTHPEDLQASREFLDRAARAGCREKLPPLVRSDQFVDACVEGCLERLGAGLHHHAGSSIGSAPGDGGDSVTALPIGCLVEPIVGACGTGPSESL